MKKIISLFQRNYEGDRLVRDEVVPGAEWVLAGEGLPTIKWDGTACRIKNGYLWKRYDCKRDRTPPPYFEPAQEADTFTGHWPGWVPVGSGPEDAHFREAFNNSPSIADGTYECLGEKVNGNPHSINGHVLWRHGAIICIGLVDRSFAGIKDYLEWNISEGIVFHHPNGRMVKIKRRDFGLK